MPTIAGIIVTTGITTVIGTTDITGPGIMAAPTAMPIAVAGVARPASLLAVSEAAS